MGQIALNLPSVGLPNSTEQPKEVSAFTTLQTVINGNLDSTNIAASLAQSAGVNYSGQVSKGVTLNAGPGTRTNAAYGALSDAADQVTGIVLATSGLIRVLYQATWQESVNGAAAADIFLGSTEIKIASGGAAAPAATPASIGAGSPNIAKPLVTAWNGLASPGFANATAYTGDVATGQVVGALIASGGSLGGPCYIFAAAGTYTISVQFKASSGTVTASNRKLWVKAESFA